MMHKKKFLWVIPVVVALIVAITGVFAVPNAMPGNNQNQVALAAGTEESENHWSCHANQGQLEKIKQLWGEDITLGQFYEQVFPEALEKIPKDIVDHLYTVKKGWTDPSGPAHPYACNRATSTCNYHACPANTVSSATMGMPPGVLCCCPEPWTVPGHCAVKYNAWSRVVDPWNYDIPFMLVESSLWYNEEDPECVDYYENCCWDCHYCHALAAYWTEEEGTYRGTGYHYFEFEEGTEPPWVACETASDWVTLTPCS